MAEHTPTPWHWDAGTVPPDGPDTYCDIYDASGDTITAGVNDQIAAGRANAQLIVTAVNSHAASAAKIDALETALREAKRQLVTLGGDHRPYPDIENTDKIQGAVLDLIDAAFAAHSDKE